MAIPAFIYSAAETVTTRLQKGYENGYFIVGGGYAVTTTAGNLTAEEVIATPSALVTYFDTQETNILKFRLGSIMYYTFEGDTLIAYIQTEKNGVRGLKRSVSPVPCSDYKVKLVRFLNKFGGFEYIIFYQRDEARETTSSAEYLQFEDGYKAVNGDVQEQISLFRDDFAAIDAPVLESLNRSQNVWFAEGWQISTYENIISSIASLQLPLSANERLIKMFLDTADFNETAKRFEAGDRVTLLDEAGGVLLDMYGILAQFSSGVTPFILIKFSGVLGNDDLTTLDGFVSGATELKLVAFDAWELCTFADATVVESGKDSLLVRLSLKTNPKQNYRI